MKLNFKNKYWAWSIIVLFTIITFIPQWSNAQETTSSGYVKYPTGWEVIPVECLDPKTTDANGVIVRCDINSFVQLFVNLAFIMLKLSPPLAMVIVVYGGFRLLTSQGKQESVQTGKKILSSVFIGMLLIIVIGWTATFFIVQTLTGSKTGTLFADTGNPFSRSWWGGSTTGNETEDPNDPNLQCCIVANVGCAMKSSTDCASLGGVVDPNVTTCLDNTQCLTIDEVVNCCISPDDNGNGQMDTCYTVTNNIAGCLQYPNTAPSADPRTCLLDNIVCDREL